MDLRFLDRRPLIVAIAGPNGAGKTTFYYSHLAPAGLRFVNADIVASALNLAPYQAADFADQVRKLLVDRRESFVFETVFSDPLGAKVDFLERAKRLGYNVLVCFIWIADAEMSQTRVAMRVASGGHDVPLDKLEARYPRTLANLRRAIQSGLDVMLFDNSQLANPYCLTAAFQQGKCDRPTEDLPVWLRDLLR